MFPLPVCRLGGNLLNDHTGIYYSKWTQPAVQVWASIRSVPVRSCSLVRMADVCLDCPAPYAPLLFLLEKHNHRPTYYIMCALRSTEASFCPHFTRLCSAVCVLLTVWGLLPLLCSRLPYEWSHPGFCSKAYSFDLILTYLFTHLGLQSTPPSSLKPLLFISLPLFPSISLSFVQ